MSFNQEESRKFKNSVKKFLSPQANQEWLKSLQLLNITPSKVILGGIVHKVYRYEIKTNHESLLKVVLEELFPEKGPFSEKIFEYKIGSNSQSFENIQPEFEFGNENTEKIRDKIVENEDISIENVAGNIGCQCPLSLDSFIPGERNLLASRACRAVVEMPGVAFNPFIIYGESGAGKTHLLEGINHKFLHFNPDKKIVQVVAEDFLNDFISHLRTNKMREFRERFRKVDVLLIDDLQTLLPSVKCQTELLHTINTLRKKKSQVVIACEQPPPQIEGLIKGLRSRLESGLTVDIGIPDDQTRIAILKNKAIERSIPLTDALATFIVNNIKGSVGRIEGVLMRLGIHSSLLNEELTIDLAKSVLKDWFDPSTPIYNSEKQITTLVDQTVNRILKRVYLMFQITEDGLQSYRRDRKHNKARQAAVFLIKKLTPFSLSEIGKIVGRNHSTVHATLKKVEERMATDDFFYKQMQALLHEFEEKTYSPEINDKKKVADFN